MLRKISLLLNSAVVVLSLLLFGYTFFAKEHLVEHTRAFVTERTLAHSKPLVELMRAGLDAPLAQKLVSEKIRSQIEGELGLYDSDPIEYVDKLTSESAPSFGTGKLAKFKASVHAYYQSTLAALVRDLRIFSGSNFVAGVFAIWLLLHSGLAGTARWSPSRSWSSPPWHTPPTATSKESRSCASFSKATSVGGIPPG